MSCCALLCRLQVSGDVFIGRYFDNEEDFKRLDFTASELSSSAAWIKEARTQIMRRSQRSDSAQQLVNRLQQQQPAAGAAKPPQSPSEVEKNKGNEVGAATSQQRASMECTTTPTQTALAQAWPRQDRDPLLPAASPKPVLSGGAATCTPLTLLPLLCLPAGLQEARLRDSSGALHSSHQTRP